MIVVTTDHGRDFKGYGHGGQSERERVTWVATNQKVNERMKSGKSAIVDIAPSISRFLGFEIPRDVLWEQDGIPFIAKGYGNPPSAVFDESPSISSRLSSDMDKDSNFTIKIK